MSLDLGDLTATAQARVSKIKKPLQPDPKVDVLESVAIVVAVVCLSLAAEYLITAFFSFLGFGALEDDDPGQLWTLARSHEHFELMNATVHTLNMTANALQQNVSDLLRENEALQQVRRTSVDLRFVLVEDDGFPPTLFQKRCGHCVVLSLFRW